MTRRELPDILGTSGEQPDGTVWAEIKVSVRTAEYENASVTLGQSLRVEGGRVNRRNARKQLLAECEREVVSKALAVKESWKDQT